MKAGEMSRAYSTLGRNKRCAQNSDRNIFKTPLGHPRHIGYNIEMQGPFLLVVLSTYANETSQASRPRTHYGEQWPRAADCKWRSLSFTGNKSATERASLSVRLSLSLSAYCDPTGTYEVTTVSVSNFHTRKTWFSSLTDKLTNCKQ